MQALFIGQTYIDVTFITDRIPTGDEKTVAEDFAVSFGGNAVTAAFACARLGIRPELLTTLADDWLGQMFRDMAARYGILVHPRRVARSSLSFVMPHEGERAIIRCRDNELLDPVPEFDLSGCRALHLDGHQPDAALAYAKECRKAGILTSLDGGTIRPGTMALLHHIDVAVVSQDFCDKLGKFPRDTLTFLHGTGVKVAGVTLGGEGAVWSEAGGPVNAQAALPVPPARVVDSNGAGDVYHGAYVYSYLANPAAGWAEHFDFARAASAHAVQHLGNEASMPTLKDIAATRAEFAAEAQARAG